MFDDIPQQKKTPAAAPTPAVPVGSRPGDAANEQLEDMLADVDTTPQVRAAGQPPAAGIPAEYMEERSSPLKKIVVAVLVLALIAAAGYAVWQFILPRFQTAGTPTITEEQPVTPEQIDQAVERSAATDKDGDGLPDERELQVGTNVDVVDTDGDGLFDGEEVTVYGTDPLKSDTDGDSFVDGQEVRGGYNPKGPGRLFDVPQQ